MKKLEESTSDEASGVRTARPPESDSVKRYRRAADYLAAAQIYLKANPLLEEPLAPEHIKDRLLGHWGTAPGINLVCVHLNRLIRRTDASVLLITGPGHGAAANMANMYIEGTLTEFYPEYTQDRAGMERFVRSFSWPYGFPSHLSPALPGVIHEGGELGYALATAFGAALDNPDLIVACIVGDGEAETGPTATAWHGNKFLSPATDGAVLPILHLNGFKIANPTISATMTEQELMDLHSGLGYAVRFVHESEQIDSDLEAAFAWAYGEIRRLQQLARSGAPVERPRWPMIVLRTPKGLGCPRELDGKKLEGSFRAHQVPIPDPKANPEHLALLEKWLRSYRPEELFDREGRPAADILALCPRRERRIAMNAASFGGDRRIPLALSSLERHAVRLEGRGSPMVSHMKFLTEYLKDVIQSNEKERNFRIVAPDELESNRLGDVLEVTSRQYVWPLPEGTEKTASDGRVLEILSEHMCQGWLQGYLLTGRHGLFSCYEAFVPIVDGMMNQYAKFLKTAIEVEWRKPISSLNYLLTSEAWRQDHNGFSHQGPGFINNLLTKKGHTYRIYHAPVAHDGGGHRPLPRRRLGLALGLDERGRGPRDRAGLQRRQPDARDPGGRADPARRGARVARSRRQRDRPDDAGDPPEVPAWPGGGPLPADLPDRLSGRLQLPRLYGRDQTTLLGTPGQRPFRHQRFPRGGLDDDPLRHARPQQDQPLSRRRPVRREDRQTQSFGRLARGRDPSQVRGEDRRASRLRLREWRRPSGDRRLVLARRVLTF